MTVVLLAEGDTERALKAPFKDFLDQQAAIEGIPRTRLVTRPRIEVNPEKLRRQVILELEAPDVTAVVGLVDVFPRFADAGGAKSWLKQSVDDAPPFYAHAAQFDVEAWLLPYWDDIYLRIGVQKRRPGAHPERVNGQNPPAYRLAELYQLAKPKPRKYNKPIEMRAILMGKDLTVSANACPEFKAFLNTLLFLGGLTPLA